MHHTYGRSEVNSGPLYNHQAVHHTHPHPRTGSERVDTRQRARPAPPQQGVVKKEPQVKPINRYAPTEYITLQYHPTPTLEDLGLTSYLDSPPSSPRATSSDQDLGHVSTSTSMITRMAEKPQAISASETVYIPRTAPKGWAPLIEVDIPSHGETPPVASMGGGNPTCTSALTSRPLQTSLAKRPRKGACDSVSHKDDLFGGVSPYSCWSQSVTEDQRPS
ncbi:uncharacterized protein LOC125665992 [Ostrea edulis]|uniref:uncharacterized protein LOC125665992 n=1 Tax=Ostrea edulis TaxID=37623 RepID=UPI0024AF4107|nr:uncharacterized protein LOC125665992 [Ostrea edulis]